jgi:hypothetical protein
MRLRLLSWAIAAVVMVTMTIASRAQQTESGINAEIQSKLPSGSPGGIPAVDLRSVLTDMNSAIFQTTPAFTVNTPAALASAAIPARTAYAYVAAMSGTLPVTSGQSNCGLMFRLGTSTPTSIYGEILNAISSTYWEPMYSTSPVKACEFKAIGNGTFDQFNDNPTCLPTCTDNTVPIQEAVNYALRNFFRTVCLNDGGYATSDTIQLG